MGNCCRVFRSGPLDAKYRMEKEVEEKWWNNYHSPKKDIRYQDEWFRHSENIR